MLRDRPVRDVVVLGGGTAGWLSAARMITEFRDSASPLRVTLIESSDIPTVGVGEATLLSFPRTLKRLGIDEADWIPRCNATLKAGIRFVGWNGGDDSFWFPFRPLQYDEEPLVGYWWKEREQGSARPFPAALGVSLRALADCRSQVL